STTVLGGQVHFSGTVTSVGALTIQASSIDGRPALVDFSPSAGGPVTLTLPSLTIYFSTVTGTDSFLVNGSSTCDAGTLSGSVSFPTHVINRGSGRVHNDTRLIFATGGRSTGAFREDTSTTLDCMPPYTLLAVSGSSLSGDAVRFEGAVSDVANVPIP